ncbi:MAG: ABC transporter ATP-binding protein [Sulfurovum sp.]|nr:ABC transporter ATP-binding protein [Sulfurovum sp.]NNJ45841.1 ABC transporter ATP-binding protein [Sulfurovum sp.]
MIQIEIYKRLHGSHGDMHLDVNLEIQKGEFVSLMGESGSGKTTLLRILAGLEKAAGNITVEEILWLGNQKMLPPQQREIGFIFQDYALFDNMSVEENLLYVNDDKILAERLLEMTELSRLSHRNVKGLSGGQKQRVSLCRAMMKKPKLLLMDEPLSALDPAMRSKLQDEIRKLHQTFGTTTIMVSHDADTAYHLSDRILVLDHGKITADGTPQEILVQTSTITYTLSS